MTENGHDQTVLASSSRSTGLWHFFSTPRGAVLTCVIALCLAVLGVLAPMVITEIRRQAVTAEISSFGFPDPTPGGLPRWGVVGRLLPERFKPVVELSLMTSLVIEQFDASTDEPLTSEDHCSREAALAFGFRSLAFFPELKSLKIDGEFTREQLLGLGPLENLKALEIGVLAMDDAVVAHVVKTYPGIKRLALGGEGISDDSIRSILQLENLERLKFEFTSLHAPALRELTKLKHLTALELYANTAISPADLKELRQILPIVFANPSPASGDDRAAGDGNSEEAGQP